ncbi:hypothetical protein [Adonisia turfae]
MTDFDEHEAFENLSTGEQKLVGILQEIRLTEDETGGEDMMWFRECVRAVSTDLAAAVAKVAQTHELDESEVRRHCRL